jgi:hypothetical protein
MPRILCGEHFLLSCSSPFVLRRYLRHSWGILDNVKSQTRVMISFSEKIFSLHEDAVNLDANIQESKLDAAAIKALTLLAPQNTASHPIPWVSYGTSRPARVKSGRRSRVSCKAMSSKSITDACAPKAIEEARTETDNSLYTR